MQTPQSIQVSGSTTAFSLTILMASLGHSSTQVSQPVHFSLSTLAGIYATLSMKNQDLPREMTETALSHGVHQQKTECYRNTMILQLIF
jgi:hypothetical protein